MSEIYGLPDGRVTPEVFEAYLAWKSQAERLEAERDELKDKLEAALRVIAAYDAWPEEGYGDLLAARDMLAATQK